MASASTVAVNGALSGNADWAMVGLEIRPGSMAKARMASESEEGTEEIRPVSGYSLQQNYPNPFSAGARLNHPNTTIHFALPEAGRVMIKVYNETGQLVRTLVDSELPPGDHPLRWNGRGQDGKILAAGLYLYQIIVQRQNGEVIFNETKRMTMLK